MKKRGGKAPRNGKVQLTVNTGKKEAFRAREKQKGGKEKKSSVSQSRDLKEEGGRRVLGEGEEKTQPDRCSDSNSRNEGRKASRGQTPTSLPAGGFAQGNQTAR